MAVNRALRWLSPVAIAAVMIGVVAAPSSAAQSGPVTFDVFVADTVTPVGGTSLTELVVSADRATTLTDRRFIFDLADLTDVATINLDTTLYDCVSSGTQLMCEFAFEDIEDSVDEHGITLFGIEVSAAAGAVAGNIGTLGVTLEVPGAAPAGHESAVTIGAPVDLAGDGPDAISGSPGDTRSLPLTVHNGGTEPAQGVALRLFKDFVLRPQTRHGNCVFLSDGDRGVLCTFDVILEPGATYTFAEPLEILIGEDAQAPATDAIEASWLTRAEAAAWLAQVTRAGEPATPGDGTPLGLVEVGGGTPAALPADPVPAADIDGDNNGVATEVSVRGDNQPDFAAVGAELSGDTGDTVEIQVGVENLGPATADSSRVGEPANHVSVTVPEGTTAVEVSDRCAPFQDSYDWEHAGEPGHARYICQTGTILPAGESVLFGFTLRIDEVIRDGTGRVRVNRPPAPDLSANVDIDPENDTAEIVVNPSGGGGELPVTGTATGVVALAGLLLVGTGGALVLLFRRRTRSVA